MIWRVILFWLLAVTMARADYIDRYCQLALQERDTNNNPQVTYTRGPDLSLTLGGAGGIGGMLARTDASGSAYYHADGSGNITALIDSSEYIAARYEYAGFGRELGQWGRLSEANRYRFSSKEIVPHMGLYYYGRRYYDYDLQRWLNRDPLGEAGGINLYQFAGNDPVNNIDPWGLFVSPSPGSISTITGTTATVAGGIGLELSVGSLGGTAIATPIFGFMAFGPLTPMFSPANDLELNPNGVNAPPDSLSYPRPLAQPASIGPPRKPPCPPAATAAPSPGGGRGGENEYTARGREAHKWWQPPDGYDKNFTFDNGLQPNAINFETQDILELKPDNPNAIAQGQNQLQQYINQAKQQFGGNWTGSVVTY